MADYNDIKQSIATNLPDNNRREITAARLRDTLNGFVDKVETTETGIEKNVSDINTKFTELDKKQRSHWNVSGSFTNNSVTIEILWRFITGVGWTRIDVNKTFNFNPNHSQPNQTLVYRPEAETKFWIINSFRTLPSDTILLMYNTIHDDFEGGVLYDYYLTYKFSQSGWDYGVFNINASCDLDGYIDVGDQKYKVGGNYRGAYLNISEQLRGSLVKFELNGNDISIAFLKDNTFVGGVVPNFSTDQASSIVVRENRIFKIPNDCSTIYFLRKSSGVDTTPKISFFNGDDKIGIYHTDSACVARFVQEMNNVAKIVGMKNSVYYEPAGYPNTRNVTTAEDLMRLGVYVSGIRQINDAWGRRSATINVYGANARTLDLTGPADATFETSYEVLGWKPGAAREYGTNTWIMVVRSKTTDKIYVLGEFDLDGNPSTLDYDKIKSVLDHIDSGGGEPDITHGSICVCELPKETPSLFSGKNFDILYSKDPTTTFLQASTTKIMTLLVASIYGLKETERVKIYPSDIQPGSGNVIEANDIITVRDLFLLGTLPSSNSAVYAIARIVGERLLRDDNSTTL